MTTEHLAKHRWLGPVGIGGVGGSGTRVIAQMLSDAGFYLGGDLNLALDNRWFTVLFKRPDWYQHTLTPDDTTFAKAVDAFVDVMLRGRRGAAGHLPTLLGAAVQLSRTGHDQTRFGSGTWPFKRLATMLRAGAPSRTEFAGWGWKEPNTHLFLPELAALIPDLRYIHVVRHGLDMAFSNNQNQLHNFGWLVSDTQAEPISTPEASLDFWIAANRRAEELGNRILGERFLVVNLDTLWQEPGPRVAELLNFVGLDADDALVHRLGELPVQPSSSGRYRDHDLTRFSPAQLDAVEALGFEVEGRPGEVAT